uniref:Uncharacterized protein n=1 Tax=Molossus molossus TaxID=27622 RepID=A0A7J8I8F9_MOLMO|nr:hypothetical protein HJG59_010645 [Molossus molossus]
MFSAESNFPHPTALGSICGVIRSQLKVLEECGGLDGHLEGRALFAGVSGFWRDTGGLGRGTETPGSLASLHPGQPPGTPSCGGHPLFQNLQKEGCLSPTKQVQAVLALSFCAAKDVRGGVFGETPTCPPGRVAQPSVGTLGDEMKASLLCLYRIHVPSRQKPTISVWTKSHHCLY